MDPLAVVLAAAALAAAIGGTVGVSLLRSELRDLRRRYEDLLSEMAGLRLRLEEREAEVRDLKESLTYILNRRRGSKETSPSAARDPNIDLKVLALRQQGMSIREIARALGISKSTVHRILKRVEEADLLANARLPNEVEA